MTHSPLYKAVVSFLAALGHAALSAAMASLTHSRSPLMSCILEKAFLNLPLPELVSGHIICIRYGFYHNESNHEISCDSSLPVVDRHGSG